MTPQRITPPGGGARKRLGGSTFTADYTARRAAPYSRAILNAQRLGKHPNVYCYAGSDCWNQAEHRRRTHGEGSTLVLPPDDDPHSYRWPRLDAVTAIPGDCDGERFRALIVALLTAGCRCIVEARPDQAPTCHYADERDALEVAA